MLPPLRVVCVLAIAFGAFAVCMSDLGGKPTELAARAYMHVFDAESGERLPS
jgi:hypothetical protein